MINEQEINVTITATDRITGESFTKELFTQGPDGRYVFDPDLYTCDPWRPLPSIYDAIRSLKESMAEDEANNRKLLHNLRAAHTGYNKGLLTRAEIAECENIAYSESKELRAKVKLRKELIKVLKEARNILMQRCAKEK